MAIFTFPVSLSDANGLITSFYKPRNGGFHDGLDMRITFDVDGEEDRQSNILAAYDGNVIRASYNDTNSFSLGYTVIIYHGQMEVERDGQIQNLHTYTVYGHLGDRNSAEPPFAEGIEVGENISAGDIIGVAGNTGGSNATPDDPDNQNIALEDGGVGPHLHFVVLQSDTPLHNDPEAGLVATGHVIQEQGPIGFDLATYAVNPLMFLSGEGTDINYELNAINDDPINGVVQNFATAWGDVGNDKFTTPEPNTEPGNTFTAANLFGKRGNDYLIGNINNDRLHGGFGNDTLVGGGGSDRIWGWQENADVDAPYIPQRIRELADDGGNDELIGGVSRTEDDNAADQLFGGNGFDTYHVGAGDIINDTDGEGRVVYNGSVLLSGYRLASDTPGAYQSLDGRYSYTLNVNTLTVTDNDNPETTFSINDFSNEYLGISLFNQTASTSFLNGTDAGDLVDIEDGEESPYVATVDQIEGTAENIVTELFALPDEVRGLGGHDGIYIYPDSQGLTVYGDSAGINPELDGNDFIEVDLYRNRSVDLGVEPVPESTSNGSTIYGEGGDDYLGGSYDNDWLFGGSGHDFTADDGGNDVIVGGAGNDWLNGNDGDDTIIGGDAENNTLDDNDYLYGGAGNDQIFGGGGADSIYGDSSSLGFFGANAATNGGIWDGVGIWDGEDETITDVIAGQSYILRDDNLEEHGNDWLEGNAGADRIFGGGGNDTLLGGTENDSLYGEVGNDRLLGGEGADTLYGDKSQTIYDQDNEVILTTDLLGQPVDLIFRQHQDGADVVGNDTLEGGVGHDDLYGGGGDDVYIYRLGEGIDIIYDTAGNADAIRFGDGITQDNVRLAVYGSALQIMIDNSVALTVANWTTTGRIESIMFEDGTVWHGDDIDTRTAVESFFPEGMPDIAVATVSTGTEEDDSFATGPDNDLVPALGGNDVVATGGGSDIALGGEGDDTLFGQDDGDVLYGQEGNDELQGNTGNDFLFGGDNDDVLFGQEDDDVLYGESGRDELYGNAGDDTLSGGEGLDDLIGGAGNDTYLFNRGDGDDIILDESGIDRIVFGPDIGPGDIKLIRSGNHLEMTLLVNGVPGSDILTVFDWFLPDNRVESVEFNDGTVWDAATIQSNIAGEVLGSGLYTSTGDEDNTYILQTGLADGFSIVIDDRGGHDELIFRPQVIGKIGNLDNIDAPYVTQFTRDGNDLVMSVTIGDRSGRADPSGTVRIVEHFSSARDSIDYLSYQRPDFSRYQFGNTQGASTHPGDYLAVLGDLTGWRWHDTPNGSLFTSQLISGDDAGNTLTAEHEAPTQLYGNGGDDVLIGERLEDVLAGGAGNDRMEGGFDDDTYHVNPEEADVIFDNGFKDDTFGSDGDVLQLPDGVQLEDLSFSRQGNDLLINAIRIERYFEFDGAHSSDEPLFPYAIERILGDGWQINDLPGYLQSLGVGDFTTLTGTGDDDILFGSDRDETLIGLGGDDTLQGDLGNDELDGGDGSDFLSGGSGNDVLDGGAGNDTLRGNSGANRLTGGVGNDFISSSGNDELIFNVGDGRDVVEYESGSKLFEFGPGIDPDAVMVRYGVEEGSSRLLYVLQYTGNDQVSFPVEEDPTENNIYRFDNGVEWGHSQLLQRLQNVPTNGDDVIVGTDGDDILSLLSGNDTVLGQDGDDTLSGNAGDDLLDGGAGNDILNGGAGNDHLQDWDDSNEFIGGAGDDTFDAGTQSDVFVFNSGDGRDTIRDFGGVDRVRFGAGIDTAMLSVTRSGQDLVISLNAGDGLTLRDWFQSSGTRRLEAFEFADGTVLNDADIEALLTVNHAPVVANSVTDQSVNEDDAFSFTLPADIFADPNAGDTLTLSAALSNGAVLPDWLSFDAQTGMFSGTPGNEQVGMIDIRVTATDPEGESVSDTFILTVNNTNDAPTLDHPVDDQNADEDVPFTFTVPADTFADIDSGDALTLNASLANGSPLPAWLNFDPESMTFSGTPANGDVGLLDVLLTATDTAGAEISDSFTLQVNNTNDAPSLANTILDQTAEEGTGFSFMIPADTFTDADAGDSLTLSATLADGAPLPDWLSFDAQTGTFSGTPGDNDAGVLQIGVKATDSAGETVSGSFSLSVSGINEAPAIQQPITDWAIAEDSVFELTIPEDTFVDPDGDNLTLSATLADDSPLPGWLSFDAENHTFSGTPANEHVGTIDLRVTATDPGGESVSDTFALTVNNTNDAPTVNGSIEDQSIEVSSAFEFTIPEGTFTDIDAGDSLILSATLGDGSALPGWLSFDAATATFSGTPQSGDVMPLQILVTATDTAAASVSAEFGLNFEGETPTGTSGDDVLTGGNGDDQLAGGEGNDTLSGGNGNDLVYAGDGDDELSGGEGNDTLYGDAGNDQQYGGAGSDSLIGGTGADLLDGGEGSDYAYYSDSDAGVQVDLDNGTTAGGHAEGDAVLNIEHVWGSGWDDALTGDTNNNYLLGGDGHDALAGGDGSDGLYGGDGDDLLSGGNGNDTLYGDAGNDSQHGGAGSDNLMGSTGVDILDGGEGSDYVYYTGSDLAVQVDLGSGAVSGGHAEDDVVLNIEHVWGSGWDDTLTGDENANYLLGNSGDDTLAGAGGSDGLYGGDGNDQLFGGEGNDTLYGQTDDDLFDGGAGTDYLIGGSGGDNYLFGYGDDRDQIIEDISDTTSTDTVLFANGIDTDEIWFSQNGDDLHVHLIGGDDRLQINDWFSDGHGIEQFQTANGDVLLESQVQQLVDAMAVFNPPDSGDLLVPQDVRDDAAMTIAASWS